MFGRFKKFAKKPIDPTKPKRAKKVKKPKSPCTYYYPTGKGRISKKADLRTIISCDPGYEFGLTIEKRYKNGKIENPVLLKENIIPDKAIRADPDLLNPCMITSASKLLDGYSDYFMKLNIVVIEDQLMNVQMLALCQHLITYFMIKLKDSPLNPVIVVVSSKMKTNMLDGPKGAKGPALIKWTMTKADELLKLRGSSENRAKLHGRGRKHDMADTICQIEALFTYLELPLTVKYRPIKFKVVVTSRAETTESDEDIDKKKKKTPIKFKVVK